MACQSCKSDVCEWRVFYITYVSSLLKFVIRVASLYTQNYKMHHNMHIETVDAYVHVRIHCVHTHM